MNALALFVDSETESGPLISDHTFIILLVVGVIVLFVVLVVAFSMWLPRFQRELQHLNLRIQQSNSERERQHYLRRRRSLWLSLIPFVRYRHH